MSELRPSLWPATIAVAATLIGSCCAQALTTVDSAALGPAPPAARWTIPLNGWGQPAVDDEAVYVLSRQHEVIAFERSSGRERWRRRTGQAGDTPLGSTLTIAGSNVLAGDYDILALDRQSGVVRWTFSPAEGYGPGLYLGGVSGYTAYAGSPSGYLYAIDTGSGALRWSASVRGREAVTVYQPLVYGDAVIAGFTEFAAPGHGGLVAFDMKSGAERWRMHFSRGGSDSPSSGWAGGPVVWHNAVVAASAHGAIYGVDPGRGHVDFVIPPHATGGPRATQDFRALAVFRDYLIAGSLCGDVVAYDAPRRRQKWVYTAPDWGSVAFGLTVDERRIYVPYVGGRLIALDGATGRPVWRTERSQGLFAWSPAVADGDVYAAGERVIAAWR
jgi:outer membrane protein assembly factor BamB